MYELKEILVQIAIIAVVALLGFLGILSLRKDVKKRTMTGMGNAMESFGKIFDHSVEHVQEAKRKEKPIVKKVPETEKD